MGKSYVLMTRTPSKYDEYYRWDFIYFPNYLELQKHLMKFPYKQNNEFVVYEETDIKRDKTLEIKTKKAW